MKRLLLFALLLLPFSLQAKEKLRVACVGNSVTYGYGLRDREHTAYPVVLQQLLGSQYQVQNFGHSGATLLRHGHRPYTQLPEFRQALDFKADLVVIACQMTPARRAAAHRILSACGVQVVEWTFEEKAW